jgi:hypothetical protein
MRLPRVRFTVQRMMITVGFVATLLAVYRIATYEVDEQEAIRIATNVLLRSDKSFHPESLKARACKGHCLLGPWTVEFSPAGSRYLVKVVDVYDSGSVGGITSFQESDHIVSRNR